MNINPWRRILGGLEMAGSPGQVIVRNWGHDRAKGEVDEAWKNAPAWLREYEAEYRRRSQ